MIQFRENESGETQEILNEDLLTEEERIEYIEENQQWVYAIRNPIFS
jgi:hypothetical protein